MSKTETIKYLKLHEKIYEVEKISFFYWAATVRDIHLTEKDVSQEEIFDVSGLKNLKIVLKKTNNQ